MRVSFEYVLHLVQGEPLHPSQVCDSACALPAARKCACVSASLQYGAPPSYVSLQRLPAAPAQKHGTRWLSRSGNGSRAEHQRCCMLPTCVTPAWSPSRDAPWSAWLPMHTGAPAWPATTTTAPSPCWRASWKPPLPPTYNSQRRGGCQGCRARGP